MMRSESLKRAVQREYERLRASDADTPDKQLWRQAKRAVTGRGTLRGSLSRRAVVGFVMVCVATGLATVLFVWFIDDLDDFLHSNEALVLWLSVLVLGPVALGVLISAQVEINRSSWGAVHGKALVWVGLALAAVGAFETVIVSMVILMSSSGI